MFNTLNFDGISNCALNCHHSNWHLYIPSRTISIEPKKLVSMDFRYIITASTKHSVYNQSINRFDSMNVGIKTCFFFKVYYHCFIKYKHNIFSQIFEWIDACFSSCRLTKPATADIIQQTTRLCLHRNHAATCSIEQKNA